MTTGAKKCTNTVMENCFDCVPGVRDGSFCGPVCSTRITQTPTISDSRQRLHGEYFRYTGSLLNKNFIEDESVESGYFFPRISKYVFNLRDIFNFLIQTKLKFRIYLSTQISGVFMCWGSCVQGQGYVIQGFVVCEALWISANFSSQPSWSVGAIF